MATMTVKMTVRDTQIEGSVSREGRTPHPYTGWLGLMSALQDAATELGERPQAQPGLGD